MKITLIRLLSIVLFSPVFVVNSSSVNAQTSGCGSGKSLYLLRVAAPIATSQFRVACNEHDACYDTLGKSKGDCDRAFHNRMLDICGRDHRTIFQRPLKAACNGRADAFYSAVNRLGKDAYNKAQSDAKQRTGKK